ncbi:hypothetical protein M1D88_18010 [Arthrobacter sp. R1-13]
MTPSSERIRAIHEHLCAHNYDWPRDPFTTSEKAAAWLEARLARATGDDEVEFCKSNVEGERGAGLLRYAATIVTPQFIISGDLQTVDPNSYPPYPYKGDVKIVPRSAIQSLTMHHVEYFDVSDEEEPDYISFTATFEGIPPLVVGMPRYSSQCDGSTARLFDSLRSDLLTARGRNGVAGVAEIA